MIRYFSKYEVWWLRKRYPPATRLLPPLVVESPWQSTLSALWSRPKAPPLLGLPLRLVTTTHYVRLNSHGRHTFSSKRAFAGPKIGTKNNNNNNKRERERRKKEREKKEWYVYCPLLSPIHPPPTPLHGLTDFCPTSNCDRATSLTQYVFCSDKSE